MLPLQQGTLPSTRPSWRSRTTCATSWRPRGWWQQSKKARQSTWPRQFASTSKIWTQSASGLRWWMPGITRTVAGPPLRRQRQGPLPRPTTRQPQMRRQRTPARGTWRASISPASSFPPVRRSPAKPRQRSPSLSFRLRSRSGSRRSWLAREMPRRPRPSPFQPPARCASMVRPRRMTPPWRRCRSGRGAPTTHRRAAASRRRRGYSVKGHAEATPGWGGGGA